MATRASRLKEIFARREATILPGTPNALFANVIERLGYECAYVTGAGIANMYLGAPDIGLVTLTEIADHVGAIADSVDLPLLVDGDTGFGNPINARRTVRLLERAGAAGIQIEDQTFPKRCGHFSGKAVTSTEDMIQKIRAIADARLDPDFQIIARTDVLAVHGINAAIERAQAYAEAGADVTFVEAPETLADIERIAREIPVPQLLNHVHGGKTPAVERQRLAELGFGAVLFANAALQAALYSVTEVLAALKQDGSLELVSDRLASFEVRQNAVRKDEYDALEQKYKN